MEITRDELSWTSDDEANWATFLTTKTGSRLIPKLAERAPALLDGADVNMTLVRNGEFRGFQLSMSALLDLSHSQPVPQDTIATTYPDLTDDSKWGDGEKLNPEPK
jgi:hypothetical protein